MDTEFKFHETYETTSQGSLFKMIEEEKSCRNSFRSAFSPKEHVLESLETYPGIVLEFYFAEGVQTLSVSQLVLGYSLTDSHPPVLPSIHPSIHVWNFPF